MRHKADAEPIDPDELLTTRGLDSSPDEMDRWFRRILIVVLAALVIAAAAGALGVTTDKVQASGGNLALEVEYATSTRAGLATAFAVSVSSLDGTPLPATLDLLVDAGYLEMFDENGLTPDPADAWSDGHWVTWTYEPPEGASVLDVSFDARLEPAVQWGRDGRVAVVVDGDEVVAVDFSTTVLP